MSLLCSARANCESVKEPPVLCHVVEPRVIVFVPDSVSCQQFYIIIIAKLIIYTSS